MFISHNRLPGLLLAAVVLLPIGCRKLHPGVPEAAERAPVPPPAAPATVVSESHVALPSGFPTDIYLPAQHRLTTAADMAGMQMVNLVSPMPMETVYAQADRNMQERGWKRELAIQSEGSGTLAFHKADRQVFYQLVRDDAGLTQLAVRVSASD